LKGPRVNQLHHGAKHTTNPATQLYAVCFVETEEEEILVALPGLEPGLFALRGRRVNQLHHNARTAYPQEDVHSSASMKYSKQPLVTQGSVTGGSVSVCLAGLDYQSNADCFGWMLLSTEPLGMIALCDADVSIGQVIPEPLDVIYAFGGIYPRNRLSPAHLERLEMIPRGVLRREIGSRRISCDAEDPGRASEDVNLHLQPPLLC
jgi:hypothetical protein